MTSTGANMTAIHSEIKLDLPVAMRIWKHKNSRYAYILLVVFYPRLTFTRFHSILYNLEAIQAAETYTSNTSDATVLDDVFYLHPLKFDENVRINPTCEPYLTKIYSVVTQLGVILWSTRKI